MNAFMMRGRACWKELNGYIGVRQHSVCRNALVQEEERGWVEYLFARKLSFSPTSVTLYWDRESFSESNCGKMCLVGAREVTFDATRSETRAREYMPIGNADLAEGDSRSGCIASEAFGVKGLNGSVTRTDEP